MVQPRLELVALEEWLGREKPTMLTEILGGLSPPVRHTWGGFSPYSPPASYAYEQTPSTSCSCLRLCSLRHLYKTYSPHRYAYNLILAAVTGIYSFCKQEYIVCMCKLKLYVVGSQESVSVWAQDYITVCTVINISLIPKCWEGEPKGLAFL